MKNKIAVACLAFGIVLGAGVTEWVNYYQVNLPYSRALDAASASVVRAKQTLAAANAQLRGFTVIDETTLTAPVESAASQPPSGAAAALSIIGAITGRNLSALAALTAPTQPAPQQQPGARTAFLIRGQVQPFSRFMDGTQAYYQLCATPTQCGTPAPVPALTAQDLEASGK